MHNKPIASIMKFSNIFSSFWINKQYSNGLIPSGTKDNWAIRCPYTIPCALLTCTKPGMYCGALAGIAGIIEFQVHDGHGGARHRQAAVEQLSNVAGADLARTTQDRRKRLKR